MHLNQLDIYINLTQLPLQSENPLLRYIRQLTWLKAGSTPPAMKNQISVFIKRAFFVSVSDSIK